MWTRMVFMIRNKIKLSPLGSLRTDTSVLKRLGTTLEKKKTKQSLFGVTYTTVNPSPF